MGAPSFDGDGRDIAARIPLTKPIQGHRELITEIILKAPTFADWREIGEFEKKYLVGDTDSGTLHKLELTVDPEAVARWFQRLSGLPMAILAQMALSDSRVVYRELQRLVGGDAGKN